MTVEPVVECSAGVIVGRIDGDLLRATGIRYARAERYGRPVDEPPASEPIRALDWSPRCPQRENPLATPGGDPRPLRVDEDCLFLSVTAPADAQPGEALPVVVWIHGGSYETGGGDELYSDPEALVSEQRVVFVTVTYRLGPLGFLGDGDRPANLGLFDLLSALRWVQRNVSAFGGDPANVTLLGQSAGADAACHLMIADGAQGLFQRVIAMSPPLGISLGRAALSARLLAQLPELPPVIDDDAVATARASAVRGLQRRFGWIAAMPFGVQYGHAPLPPESELDQAFEAAAPGVDVLIGSGIREAALFAELMPTFAALRRTAVGRVAYERAVDWATRHVYDRGIEPFVERHRRGGGRVWRYEVDWGAGPRFQGSHVMDLALVFPTEPWLRGEMLEGLPLEAVAEQGRAVRAVWADFARTGDVAVGDLPGVLTVG